MLSDKTEIKIFILFLLDEIRYPLDGETITRVVQENGYLGMFDFAECFSELKELGHVNQDEKDGVVYYTVSETGHLVASELQDTIMESIRTKSSKSAAKLLSLHKRGAVAGASVRREEDGRYRVDAAITEKGKDLYHITMVVSSEQEAEKIRENFNRKPEEICCGLLAVMTGELDYYLK